MKPPRRPDRPKLTPDEVIDVAAAADLAVNTVRRWLRGERVRGSSHYAILDAMRRVWVGKRYHWEEEG